MRPEEKLRGLLKDYERAEADGAAFDDHLRDEDFIRLIENAPSNISHHSGGDESLRRHLAVCDSCLDQFKDFYAFFAPAESGEAAASKSEIDAAWQTFAPRIAERKTKNNFWTRLFPAQQNPNYFPAFGWAFAALLLFFTGIAAFVAWQARSENSQLAAQLETQRETSEERLKSLEQSAQNSNAATDETHRLQSEKDDLQNKIARLQIEIERAKQPPPPRREIILPSNPPNISPEKTDNSLVAVNTPIYDIFPAEAVVRGGAQTANKLIVPKDAKNVVLILNAAGRADFPVTSAVLVNGTGKIVWRGGGLRKDSTGNFTLTLSRAALKTGNYRLDLSGKNKSEATNGIEYPIYVQIDN